MPWKILKRPCKKSDGKTGKYVIVKIKRGGGTEQSSCHTSKKKAQGGVRARHANEGKMKITKNQLRRIIKEERAKLNEQFDGSMMDLEDYQRLENLLQRDLKVFLRGGYTKADIIQALKTIVEDA